MQEGMMERRKDPGVYIVAKEIYEGGGVRQNIIWGIGAVDAKQCRVGYARGGERKPPGGEG